VQFFLILFSIKKSTFLTSDYAIFESINDFEVKPFGIKTLIKFTGYGMVSRWIILYASQAD